MKTKRYLKQKPKLEYKLGTINTSMDGSKVASYTVTSKNRAGAKSIKHIKSQLKYRS